MDVRQVDARIGRLLQLGGDRSDRSLLDLRRHQVGACSGRRRVRLDVELGHDGLEGLPAMMRGAALCRNGGRGRAVGGHQPSAADNA